MDGTVYTAAQFRQETPRIDGQAWLSVEKVLTVQPYEEMDMWMYDFIFHEMNGVGAHIDGLVMCHFVRNGSQARQFTGESLAENGLPIQVDAHGEWRINGGLPVQEAVSGVGIALTITDDTGTTQTFNAYLPLSA